MTNPSKESAHDSPSGSPPVPFLETKKFADWLFYSVLGICVLLVVVDVAYQPEHSHWHFDFESYDGFHAGFGFLAYVSIVTLAKGLRRIVKRKEDYYDE